MTLLISMLARDEIAVVMDTFGMGGEPGRHYTKCWAPDSGRFIVAGTGLADVVSPWLDQVAAMPAASEPHDVAEMTLDFLAMRSADLPAEAEGHHSTAYIYSFSTDRHSPLRQSFSSRDSFERREKVTEGFWIAPQVPIPLQLVHDGLEGTDQHLLALAQYVALECDRGESEVHIAGEARVIRINPRGLMQLGTIGRIR
ncbi:hypothetical protein [Tsukamurella pseudospumae]|uniref:Uncharacterized protein n=1 Tax=Tsukamurella pseudospumae TaxID=239498 RepID=A0A137ZZ65_9ACTN|nr:hypothetical protein [Tsukamurella pseudospumae]KXO98021.1 hypothetical protein AXK61_20890 [Tsukamurella pseudospumae]KXP03493.1 hypothetical protein AXK60_16880 [Tsukamurella pseudospumae]